HAPETTGANHSASAPREVQPPVRFGERLIRPRTKKRQSAFSKNLHKNTHIPSETAGNRQKFFSKKIQEHSIPP
ncbi:hypothetical protein, partial [Acetobacter estunensis]|uniref:hypothetical protein n=1 Tax=Acetobacter estunensis TaxID=104097 RepID=UPI001A7F02EA